MKLRVLLALGSLILTVHAAPPASTVPSNSNYVAHRAWNEGVEKNIAAMKGQPCDVIFIGDSITQNFAGDPSPKWDLVGGAVWRKYYDGKHVLNFGVGADTTQNVLWRFDHMDVKGFRPKVAVILIGTNNIKDAPADIATGVKAVIAKTQQTFPGVKIILVSILPNSRQTQKMADANKIIKTFGDDRTVFYFDLAALMTPTGNNWKGVGRDHLHLTVDGYELWASSMQPLLDRLLAMP